MKNKNQEEQIETQGGKNNWVRHVTLIASVNESCNISTSSVWFIEHLLCARSHFFFLYIRLILITDLQVRWYFSIG